MITAIIQARMGSSRLPGKVLRFAAGKPILQHVVDRVMACTPVSQVIVATTDWPSDQAIVEWCRQACVEVVAVNRLLPSGQNDVLWRYSRAAKYAKNDILMRVTADCPLWCPLLGREVAEQYIALRMREGVAICSNVHPQLDGFDTEVFDKVALDAADRFATSDYDRAHVTPFLYKRFTRAYVDHLPKVGGRKLSVDTEEDFQRVRLILERVGNMGWEETSRYHTQTEGCKA